LISDYYDPGSNTIHIFSDDPAIALHESAHALDFSDEEFTGSYALARIVPGVNLVQERLATEEALYYLEKHGRYEELLHAYKILYPAYATYIIAYFPLAVPAYVGAILLGHAYGRFLAREKEYQLKTEGKYPEKSLKLSISSPA